MLRKPLESVIIKPAGPDCNLNCEYCFYLDKTDLFPNSIHRMVDSTLDNLIKQLMEQSGNYISITWQGGEPTIAGLEFFQKVIETETKYGNGKQVANSLQTNGTLLNSEWADFLKKYNFLVGLSIDGPQHVHDHYRKFSSGNGSWDKVSKNAKMLLDKEVLVNSLSCVTDYSSRHPEEIYQYLKNSGFNFMQFIPIVEQDKDQLGQAASFSVSGKQYGQFLCDIFDLWWNDYKKGITYSVRHIDSVFHRFVDIEAPECPLKHECGVYLVVEHNGDVFPCDFFVTSDWKLGNIADQRLTDMLNSDKMRQFGQLKSELPHGCPNCKWLEFCFGGCTKDRVRDKQDKGQNHFCTSYKMFLEHSHPILSQLAKDWKKQNQKTNRSFDASGYF